MNFEESRLTDFRRGREQTKLKVSEGAVGLVRAAPKVKKIYGGKKHDTRSGVGIRMGLFRQGQSVSNAPPLCKGVQRQRERALVVRTMPMSQNRKMSTEA